MEEEILCLRAQCESAMRRADGVKELNASGAETEERVKAATESCKEMDSLRN